MRRRSRSRMGRVRRLAVACRGQGQARRWCERIDPPVTPRPAGVFFGSAVHLYRDGYSEAKLAERTMLELAQGE